MVYRRSHGGRPVWPARSIEEAPSAPGKELRRLAGQFRRSGLLRQWAHIGEIGTGSDDVTRRVTAMLEACSADLESTTDADPPSRSVSSTDLGRALVGMEWSDALMTIVSLDLIGNRAASASASQVRAR